MKSYCCFDLVPSSAADWRSKLERVIGKDAATPKFFLYDIKNEHRMQLGELQQNPYKRPPVLVEKDFRGVIHALPLRKQTSLPCVLLELVTGFHLLMLLCIKAGRAKQERCIAAGASAKQEGHLWLLGWAPGSEFASGVHRAGEGGRASQGEDCFVVE